MPDHSVLLCDATAIIENGWTRVQAGEPVWGDLDLVDAITTTLRRLDAGELRVATQDAPGNWTTHEWIKKALLLSFRVSQSVLMGPTDSPGYDKVPSKFGDWDEARFHKARIRVVPPATVRYSAYLADGVVIMPSFVNVGAHIGADTMIDSWATVGSCAQVGERCHISAGACIAGVLEPAQASPVVIEDRCFIGAGSVIAEGVIVEEGAVVSAGVAIDASTPIIDGETGRIHRGRVPTYSVIKSGILPTSGTDTWSPLVRCAVMVKQVDERTRSKTSINDLLR